MHIWTVFEMDSEKPSLCLNNLRRLVDISASHVFVLLAVEDLFSLERSARVEVLSISTLPSQIESERKARVICSRASLRAREQITSALSQTRDPPSQSGSTFVESFTLEGSGRASFTAYLLLL